MNIPNASPDSLLPSKQDENCPVGNLPSPPVGIVETKLEPDGQSVTIDYDLAQ